MKMAEMRDLKADLELCQKVTPGPWEAQPFVTDRQRRYEVFDATGQCVCTLVDAQSNAAFIAQAREGWPHAIERAIEAEESLKIITALADVERIGELESLVRELAGALWNVMDIALRDGWTREQVKRFEDAKAVYFKAKEVLGDE